MMAEAEGGAIAHLYALQNELEAAASAAHVPPGLGPLAARLLDTLRSEGAAPKPLRRAEGILLDLQRVEMSKRAGDGRHVQLLVSCRDAARMMVADYRRAGGFV